MSADKPVPHLNRSVPEEVSQVKGHMWTQFPLVQYGVTEQVAPKTHVKGAASVWTELQECPRQVS